MASAILARLDHEANDRGRGWRPGSARGTTTEGESLAGPFRHQITAAVATSCDISPAELYTIVGVPENFSQRMLPLELLSKPERCR
jgi:hypothetical protein